jgi:hypothetical protein
MKLAFVMAALLQAEPGVGNFELFNPGAPPVFKEETDDRRFEKTAFFRALSEGPPSAPCARVLGSYFAALANAAPYFHKRDADFYVDQRLMQVLTSTAGGPMFPAPTYLTFMIRQVLIERSLPQAWFNTAKMLVARTGAPIDLARLAFIADGVHRLDSFYFSLPALIDRYKKEVALAPSAGQPTARQEFHDRYVDREVAWGGLTLIDVQRVEPEKSPPAAEVPTFIAHLALTFPLSQRDKMMGRKAVDPLRITARLREKQYIDVTRVEVSRKFLIRGRLWSFDNLLQGIELNEAILFEETNWNTWNGTSSLADVASCPLCINELANIVRAPAFQHDKTY